MTAPASDPVRGDCVPLGPLSISLDTATLGDLSAVLPPRPWARDAACVGMPTDWFFTERGESTRESERLKVTVDAHLDDLAVLGPLLGLLAAVEEAPEPDSEVSAVTPPPVTALPVVTETAGPVTTKPKPAKVKTNGTKPATDRGVELLRALNELGGEVFDPSGRAATKLFDAAGVDAGYGRSLLPVLDEAGHITRTVNGKRTSRIVLTPSGLGVVDGSGVSNSEIRNPEPEPSTSNGVASMCLTKQHALCAAVPGKCSCDCHPKVRSRS